MTKAYTGTQSVIRAIQLLKLFRGEKTEWSLQELVAESQLNKTTVFRMMSAFESEGMIERSANGSYQMGAELIALGGHALRNNQLRQVAHEALLDLVQRTNERATLEMAVVEPNGRYAMLVLDEVKSNHLININQYVGSRIPIHATSTGKAVLAHMSSEEQTLAIAQTHARLTDKTVVDETALQQALNEIKVRGYALAMGELEAGVMAAGAPIFNYSGDVVAAVSVVGPDSRIDADKLNDIAVEVLLTAKRISQKLGHQNL